MPRPNLAARRAALRQFIERSGLTVNGWALKAEMSEGTVRNFLKSSTASLNDSSYQKLAAAASELLNRKVTVAELQGEAHVAPEIRVEGYVGAGAEIFSFGDSDTGDTVPAPPHAGRNVEAVRVRGESMWPVYRDGDVLFYSRDADTVDPTLVGQDCIVRVADGRTFVKVLQRGSEKRRWTLRSWNAPDIANVRLEWATPVRWVKRGR